MAVPASGSRTVPAQLGFLTIYNPSLGDDSDDTIDDQIVYYASITSLAASTKRRRPPRGRPTEGISPAERNERLRQIGLAQGMVGFGRGFSDGEAVDCIETETLRVTVHELEPGWWILASINLNKIPLPPQLLIKNNEPQQEKYEYNSREMKPTALILRDLQRAYSIFLMHHDVSLNSLFLRLTRRKFVTVLGRYWDLFLSTWSVSLHGNPARDIYQGINIAASGELGIGVGEEERGSGERDVLEALVDRTEGLVDLIVSKFGHPDVEDTHDAQSKGKTSATATARHAEPWLGSGREPSADDGAIFLGTGALSRHSLRDVTHWMEDLYTWGDHAYGVIESPISTRKARPKRNVDDDDDDMARKSQAPDEEKEHRDHQGQVPDTRDPDERGTETEASEPSKGLIGDDARDDQTAQSSSATGTQNVSTAAQGPVEEEDGKLDKMVSYLKLGYGQYWTIPGVSSLTGSSLEQSSGKTENMSSKTKAQTAPKRDEAHPSPSQKAAGHYLIGLRGEIEEAPGDDGAEDAASDDSETNQGSRTVLRTIQVELESKALATSYGESHPETPGESEGDGLTARQMQGSTQPGSSQKTSKTKKLRVVVYVNRPFVFVFLFRLRTDSLAWDSLYRSLHYQLSPLREPLVTSTRYRPERPPAGGSAAAAAAAAASPGAIYDLMWKPRELTVHSTVPSIPETNDHDDYCCYYTDAGKAAAADDDDDDDDGSAAMQPPRWSRLDAMNTHQHMLAIFSRTRGKRVTDIERTQKTSRGWWIVWMRLVDRTHATTAEMKGPRSSSSVTSAPTSPRLAWDADDDDDKDNKDNNNNNNNNAVGTSLTTSEEVFLIRQASDHASWGGGGAGLGGGGGGVGGGGQGDTMGKLVQGIGVDTRRYVEDLLSML